MTDLYISGIPGLDIGTLLIGLPLDTFFYENASLTSIPDITAIKDSLVYLSLRHNKLTTIEYEDLPGATKIRQLDVRDNELTYINLEWLGESQASAFMALQFENNRLRTVPNLMGNKPPGVFTILMHLVRVSIFQSSPKQSIHFNMLNGGPVLKIQTDSCHILKMVGWCGPTF